MIQAAVADIIGRPSPPKTQKDLLMNRSVMA